MDKFVKNKNGFTLVETLIYLSIVSAILVGFVSFSISISDVRAKNYASSEVQANLRVALDIVTQKIRSANGVNLGASTFDVDPGVLSLSMADSAKNPTIIKLDQDNGTLQVQEGSSPPVSIISSEVKMTNLIFTNLTQAGRNAIFKINMTIDYNDIGGDVNYVYSQSIQTAVGLRQ